MPKICCISDNHGFLPDIDPCDLMLMAGDINPRNLTPASQFDWLDTRFRIWLNEVPVGEVIAIAGNHDFVFRDNRMSQIKTDLPWIYLQDSGTEFEGYKIWGSPWQPTFYDWAFNMSEDKLAGKWALIPDDTEILLTHGPPYRIRDESNYVSETHEANAGSKTLLERVWQLPELKLHVFGHVHPAFGEIEIAEALYVNACYVDSNYEPRPEAPIYITLPDK